MTVDGDGEPPPRPPELRVASVFRVIQFIEDLTIRTDEAFRLCWDTDAIVDHVAQDPNPKIIPVSS